MAKRRSEAAREGEEKSFGDSAVHNAHEQLHQRGNTASDMPAPLSNKILDSIKGYLDNIAAAATQVVAEGDPLAELSASLAISIDTVAPEQKEIKRIYEQIKAMKNKGTQASNISPTEGGVLTGDVCPHCAAVGHTSPHRNNSCYLNTKKMTDRRELARKFMDKKVVACNDNN